MFGFLNVYKPKGMTSHDVVSVLRRITKIKQIGHTGTLDPFAQGVLPICIGKATRLIEYLNDDKAYVGTVQLGSSTTTYDIEGEIVHTSHKLVTIEEIETALENFRGNIEQLPPIYSAIKVNGKKLYDYARNGEEVKIEPRKVTIYKLELLNYNKEANTLELHIECSKGTYIRSIANDLGEKLGVHGHLIKLERIKAGKFLKEDAITLETLSTKEIVEKNIIYPMQKLDLETYELNQKEQEKVSHGMPITPSRTFIENCNVILTSNKTILAIAKYSNNILKCEKVFL